MITLSFFNQVRLVVLPPFPASRPGATHSPTALLCYACQEKYLSKLRFILYTLLLDMKHHATDRFMRDSICSCYRAERFLLLHHTMYYCRPVFGRNTVVRVFRP
jgi:hypothetical protein